MKSNMKSFLLGFVVCAMLGSTTVYATDSTRIEVYFKKLKYVFNGIEKVPNSAGEGFIYQGTTYVPLRFVSESLDKEVSWNPGTGTIRVSDHPSRFLMEDLSITDTLTNSIIRVGMSKKEVEQKLGIAADVNFLNIYNYNGLEIFYRNDKVAGLMVKTGENTTNRYQTNKHIGLGDNYNKIFTSYGNGLVDEQFDAATFLFASENGKLNKVDSREDVTDTSSAYVISLSWDRTNKTVSMILIGDYQFAYSTQ
ncbi:stalk domain-containing protein [Paenibacillus sp. GCM10023250]|uniref:stalk domain-containing protein n=1 Tax=Paenibacillus sp. GCM10023250 TaxID=3252648 RepID=UPI0036189F09